MGTFMGGLILGLATDLGRSFLGPAFSFSQVTFILLIVLAFKPPAFREGMNGE